MFTFNGTIYDAAFHLQTDPDSFCTSKPMCEGPPDPETVRRLIGDSCGVEVSGIEVPKPGTRRIEASPIRAAGAVAPGAAKSAGAVSQPRSITSASAALPRTIESPPDEETPEQKLARLRDERRDHMIYLGALLGGFVVGLWVEGK